MRRAAVLAVVVALAATGCERSIEGSSRAAPSTVRSDTDQPVIPSTTAMPQVAPSTVPDPSTVPESSTVPAAPAMPSCLDSLTVRERAALLVWPAVYSTAWEAAIATVRDLGVGGVMLMEPRDWSADEIGARLDELELVARSGLVIATDEEGGNVQRLRLLGGLPSQQEMSETGTPESLGALIAPHAAIVRDVGIDMVFAPVVDVVPSNGEVALDRSRFFTGDANGVTEFARAAVTAWSQAGVVPVLKHFPGHGSASADTHLDAAVTEPVEVLEAIDLVPYRELADTGAAVMVGHLTVPGLTGDLPATRSPAAIARLRAEPGFADALVISDALEMGAVGLPVDQAAVAAIAAGVDVALFTDTSVTGAVIDSIERAVADGTIPADRLAASARRVLRVTGADELGCDPG